MKIIAFYNAKGGVHSTTYAAHTALYAAERGVRVAAATVGPSHDLRPFMSRAGIPWYDALEGLPTTDDLLILDVHSHLRCAADLRPDLWVMPMCNRTAYENAAQVMPSLVGPALWVWTAGRVYSEVVPAALRDRVSMAPVVMPRSRAMAESGETWTPAWSTRIGARSPGARTMQALAMDVLEWVGMPLALPKSLPQHAMEAPSLNSPRGFLAREELARPALRVFFETRQSAL